MSEHLSSPRISRRSVLRGGAAAAVAVGLPPAAWAAERRPGAGIANVHVSHDHYGVHLGPSVAANPRHPRQLLAACQASPTTYPQLIATYLSFDGGAT
jgi:TAT (twin-arginine translocation) pathway signal sequence